MNDYLNKIQSQKSEFEAFANNVDSKLGFVEGNVTEIGNNQLKVLFTKIQDEGEYRIELAK